MGAMEDGGPAVPTLKPATRFEWERIVRSLRIPSSVKFLAFAMSTYAERDGTRVRPGVERLALVMCVSEKTVKRGMSELRELGLIERVKQGNRHAGRADEYRLTSPVDMAGFAFLNAEETEMSAGLP